MSADVDRRSYDHSLVYQIKDALRAEGLSSAPDIGVTVRDGVVTLTGMVDVLAEKRAAEEICYRIPGVVKVENGLTISVDGPVDDGDVEEAVRSKLDESGLPEVGLQVSRGAVELVGRVETLDEAQTAVRAAEAARGVKAVRSSLAIDSEADDATIVNEVERRLANSGIGAAYIAARSRDGEVELEGSVADRDELNAVEELVRSVRGVRAVRSRLTIRDEI